MTLAAADLLQLAQGWLLTGGLVFLRVGAAAALVPVLGEQAIPARLRLAAALALTAVVAPAVAPGLPDPTAAPLRMIGAETVAGLSLGFGLRLLVWALQTGGAMIAQATSLSQMAGGAAVEPQPAIGAALTMGGLALAAAGGLHVRLAALFILSYRVLPAGHFPDPSDLTRWSLGQIGSTFTLAFAIAAPFLVAALLYNVATGLMNRAMPQLMVSFIGAPLLTFGALAMFVAVAPPALVFWSHRLAEALATPFGAPP